MDAPARPSRTLPAREPSRGRPTPPERPPTRFPEPPAFRAGPLAAPRACATCAAPVRAEYATPRCWGCGRPLCAECYWRHGATPATHRCTSCLVSGPAGSTSVSGARAVSLSTVGAGARNADP